MIADVYESLRDCFQATCAIASFRHGLLLKLLEKPIQLGIFSFTHELCNRIGKPFKRLAPQINWR